VEDDEVEFDGVLLLVEFPVELPLWVGAGVKVTGIAVVKVEPWETTTESEVETTGETETLDDEALLLWLCDAVRGSETNV
jgi:hypothetical protein